MFHLRLCKAISYSGIISATKAAPDVFIEDKATANAAVATGFFELVAIEETAEMDEEEKELSEMTVEELKAVAAQNGISLTGVTKRADIIARIEATAPAVPVGGDTGNEEEDPTNQFIGGEGGASE